MLAPPPHLREAQRLALVRSLERFGTEPELQFEELTKALAIALDAPIAMITIIDSEDIWFLTCIGLPVRSGPRELSICGHTILQEQVLTVNNTLADQRFFDNPSFNGDPPIRAYAGIALASDDGLPFGTMCVCYHDERKFAEGELEALRRFAAVARRELLSRKALNQAQEALRQREADLEASRHSFESIFHKAAIGIALVGADGRWLQVNETLCRTLGYSMEELLGRDFQQLTWPGDLDADREAIRQLLSGEIERRQLEKRYIRKDGRAIWANVSVSIERDGRGGHHFIAVVEDIQARKEAEHSLRALRLDLEHQVEVRTEALREANARLHGAMSVQLESERQLRARRLELRSVINNAPDAYVCIDEAGVICDWNLQAEATFGWTRDEALGRRLDETLIPSGQREAHREGMHRHRATGESRVLGQRIEMQAIRRDGSTVPVEVRIQMIEVDGGRRYTAFLHDITERKLSEQALQAQQRRLQLVADHVPALVSWLDTELRYRFANEAYRELLGIDPATLIGQKVNGFLGEESSAELQAVLARALAGETVSGEHHREYHGQRRYWSYRYLPEFGDGKVVGLHGMVIDVTERRERELLTERDAQVDELTGLMNRRGLFQALQEHRRAADTRGQGFGVLLLDLNRFKAINDTRGHQAGDAVLRAVARRVEESGQATAARLGGDEFVLIVDPLSGDGELALARIGRDLAARIAEPIVVDGASLSVGVSVGLSHYAAGSGISSEALLHSADQWMYREKGRHSPRLRALSRGC